MIEARKSRKFFESFIAEETIPKVQPDGPGADFFGRTLTMLTIDALDGLKKKKKNFTGRDTEGHN